MNKEIAAPKGRRQTDRQTLAQLSDQKKSVFLVPRMVKDGSA